MVDWPALQNAIFGMPLYQAKKRPKVAIAEIIKKKPTMARELEFLVHSYAIFPRAERRLYEERDNG